MVEDKDTDTPTIDRPGDTAWLLQLPSLEKSAVLLPCCPISTYSTTISDESRWAIFLSFYLFWGKPGGRGGGSIPLNYYYPGNLLSGYLLPTTKRNYTSKEGYFVV
jgi:hypothetical protein